MKFDKQKQAKMSLQRQVAAKVRNTDGETVWNQKKLKRTESAYEMCSVYSKKKVNLWIDTKKKRMNSNWEFVQSENEWKYRAKFMESV